MSTFLTDSFTDASATDMSSHVGEVGATWTNQPGATAGDVVISNANRARGNGTSNTSAWYASGTPATADYYCEAALTVITSTGYTYPVAVRMSTSANTQYMAGFEFGGVSSANLKLYKVVAETTTQLGSTYPVTVVNGTDYTIRLSAVGSSLTVTLNGTSVITASDSAITAAGRAGFQSFTAVTDSSGYQINSITAADIGSSATTLTLSGPTSGAVSVASTNFTVTPDGTVSSDTVTMHTGGTGTFSPTTLTFTSSSTPQTFTYTPSTTAGSPHSISITDSASLTIAGSPIAYTVNPAAQTIPVTDSHLYFSPYNWDSDGAGGLAANNVKGSSTYARTSNPGAYLKFIVTSAGSGEVSLNLDTTMLQTLTAANCPTLYYSVDGKAFVSSLLAYSSSAVQISIGSGLAAGDHTFEINFKSVDLTGTSSMGNRWTYNGTGDSVVKVTGIQIDGASSMQTQTLRAKRVAVFGDSITEGAETSGSSLNDASNDSTQTYGRWLSRALAAEYGIVGWSAQGWTATGYGGAPTFPNAWAKYNSADSRSWTNAPDYVVVVHGKNDSGASDGTVTTAINSWLTAARSALGGTPWIFLVCPFDGTKRSAVNAATLPDSKCKIIDLGTIPELISGSSTGLFAADSVPHPNARGHANFGAMLAARSQTLIDGGSAQIFSPIGCGFITGS